MNQPTPQTDGAMSEELALLGHDIRSALADVSAGLALLDASNFTQQNQMQLDGVKATAESLSRFLDEGLTTLLTQAAPELTLATTDIAEMLHDLQRRWSFSAGLQTNSIKITTRDLPAAVLCNRTAVERVLSNLLSNALAHSGGRPVSLDVTHPAPDQLRFMVTDSGPGFPDAVRNKPGQIHTPAMPAWQDRQGHGLGIRIARSLAQRMNATLNLLNQPNGGALAELVLPIAIPAPDDRPAVDTSCLKGKKVLIADDSMPQLMILQQYLRGFGANTTVAHDGPSAEAALMAGGFDIAFIDYEMPHRSGLEICRALRDHPNPQAAPTQIIILTAHNLPEFFDKALAAGADRLLVKPIASAADLLKAICGPLPPAPQDQTSSDPAAFSRLLDMAGPSVAHELALRYIDDLMSIQSKLLAALPAQDWPSLAKASHVLIALAGTAGMAPLENHARAFNLAASTQDSVALDLQQKPVMDGLADLLKFIARIAQERQNQP
ncbi:hybrid sensor histidine kinase/response regulator [Pseudorhodobacter sp. W20_MBD10_FR17]|uniref:ATP-binding response regulator n=1 Tax=Pseudorhodobacter sp. W20_MBD10_FR17 TaxID=3240266 RepID=UPI003F9CA3DA